MENIIIKEPFPFHTTINNHRDDEVMRHFGLLRKAQKHPSFTFRIHYSTYSESVDDPYSYRRHNKN
ncbi:MAG: hypothetical protein LAT68_13380 [Cyclobacteriaceae bacterium]|nr:hypothetical protein [Cyclobacteriaceae bacterium]MCH8517312.1 hypothetical protein [Cyclobacteriaceae bacterium]